MSLLVTEQLFPIAIKYIDVPLKGGMEGVFIIDTPEKEKKYGDKVKKLETQWIRPSFRQMNDLHRETTITNSFNGEKETDWILYQSLIMEKFLRHWDIEEGGKPVPCTPENMGKLDPVIARALLDAFNKHSVPSEDYLKN